MNKLLLALLVMALTASTYARSPRGAAVPAVAGPCTLAAVGVWQQITPAGLSLAQTGSTPYGAVSIVMSPTEGTIYAGSAGSGLFKSTDCGTTFALINTGSLTGVGGVTSASALSAGSMTAMIDPTNANNIYSYSLYGENGFFESTNGGVDWVNILTSNIQTYAPDGGFVSAYVMDPSNHLHILVTWHAPCASPYNSVCFAETTDGGSTWTMRNGLSAWTGGEGVFLNFLTSTAWVFSSSSNGMWLSTDSGSTWTQITIGTSAHGDGQLLRMANGSYFWAAENGILYSPDATSASDWSLLATSGNLDQGLATDGTNLWRSQAFPYNPGSWPSASQQYWSSTTANPTSWTLISTAPSTQSGAVMMAYDPTYHILYSADYISGVWRVVIE